ncbi:kinase [Novilysobacter erysipheiresistens]|uniref:Kinase n=1 Tax=Novilysobacter erysipheiresistens TaxID=1749332 RepID=A0ABU7Z1F4_9GAMM
MTARPQITAPGADPRSPGYAPAFVADVLDDALAHDCRVYSITGLQGTGKSTIAAQLVALARERGVRAMALSIDDFYLDHDARVRLGHEVHPLLATRGPPGSHDVALACEVVDALREGRGTRLPRFDKIADRRLPRAEWPVVDGAELVLFEGWFQKVPAQSPEALADPVNALERDEDPDGIWRAYCNDSLARDYAPLWSRLDRLLFLQGPGVDQVPEWRWQQECTLQAAHPDRAAMTRPQVLRFVQFFERVSRHGWPLLPEIADRTVRLDASRRPID